VTEAPKNVNNLETIEESTVNLDKDPSNPFNQKTPVERELISSNDEVTEPVE